MKLQWGKKGRASLVRLESQGDLQVEEFLDLIGLPTK